MWIPFASARDSEIPHGLNVRSLSGFSSGLIRQGFIATGWGDKHGLKHVIAVKITRPGLKAVQPELAPVEGAQPN